MDLWIKIRSLFEKKAIDDAAKGVEDIGKKSEEAGKKQKSAASSAKEFGGATGRAAEMVGSLTGAMGANSPAAAKMGAGLRVIKSLSEGSAGGIMGLTTVIVGIGVSAWAAYQRKVEEAKKKLDEFVSQMTDRKIETGARRIEAIAEGFGRVEKAISSARAAQSELAAAWDDLNRAGQEVTSMELERREKADLARLNPEDQAGAAAVRARYAGLRESAALGARAGGAIRAEQAAQDDLTAASERRANIEKTLGSSISARNIVAAQLARSSSRADPSNHDEEDRKNAAKETAAFTAQLAALNKSIVEMTDSLQVAKTSERAAGIKLEAANVRATRGVSAAQSLAEQNTSDANLSATRTAWAELERVAREKRDALDKEKDIRERAAELRDRADKETADVRRARNGYASDRSLLGPPRKGDKVTTYGDVEKEEEEARRAVKAVNGFAAEASKALAELTAQMQKNAAAAARANEALRNLPNN